MTVYLQMGHASDGLIGSPHMDRYTGAILSPVNYIEADMASHVARFSRSGVSTIFDPQLYYPNSERGKLPDWSYYPKDFDTADFSSRAWWQRVAGNLVDTATRLNVSALATPAVVPRMYTDDYYAQTLLVANDCASRLGAARIDPVLTLLCKLDDLAEPRRAEMIASIASGGNIDRVLLVFVAEVPPRSEFADTEGLKGGMRLITALKQAGSYVLVGFSSSDVLLWKHAGADGCATGKFFNLRRFTRSRFDPPAEGGGQLPYWFEEGLIAFLRESDILRVRREGLLSPVSTANPFAAPILEAITSRPPGKWLSLSWRFYLHWFADLEQRCGAGAVDAASALRKADVTWSELDKRGILMEERRNDGAWVRAWRRAIAEL